MEDNIKIPLKEVGCVWGELDYLAQYPAWLLYFRKRNKLAQILTEPSALLDHFLTTIEHMRSIPSPK
jgi:hypothetical protein